MLVPLMIVTAAVVTGPSRCLVGPSVVAVVGTWGEGGVEGLKGVGREGVEVGNGGGLGTSGWVEDGKG